jgi:hypothetical protein
MHWIGLRRPSPALVIASIALFVSLAGGAYAAVSLPRGSVGTAQLRRGAVTAVKVKSHSLLARDFKAGQLPRGATGATGAPGATGPQGPAGTPGQAGAVGISDYQVVLDGELVQPTDTSGEFDASCPTGTKILGGGVATFNKNIQIESSTPIDNGTDWVVSVVPLTGATFGGGGASSVNIRIVCAKVDSTS